MMKKIIGFLIFGFLFFGCGKTVLNAELNKDIELHLNQKIKYPNSDLQVTIVDVKEDSRCPKGTNCVWEGRVVLDVLVNSITIPISTQTKLDTLGYTFSIQNVIPEKTTSEILLNDYIITLLVTK